MEEHAVQVMGDLLDEIAEALSRASQRIREAPSARAGSEPGHEPEPLPDWLTTAGLAAWLQRREQTVRKWRHVGGGPPYVRLGDGLTSPVVYRRQDVEDWLAKRTFRHTSEETVKGLRS